MDVTVTLKVNPQEFATITAALEFYGARMLEDGNNSEYEPALRRDCKLRALRSKELIEKLA